MPSWNNFILSADFKVNLGETGGSRSEADSIYPQQTISGLLNSVKTSLFEDAEETHYKIKKIRTEMEEVATEFQQQRASVNLMMDELPNIK